jgi:hypothetical protein
MGPEAYKNGQMSDLRNSKVRQTESKSPADGVPKSGERRPAGRLTESLLLRTESQSLRKADFSPALFPTHTLLPPPPPTPTMGVTRPQADIGLLPIFTNNERIVLCVEIYCTVPATQLLSLFQTCSVQRRYVQVQYSMHSTHVQYCTYLLEYLLHHGPHDSVEYHPMVPFIILYRKIFQYSL